MIKCGFFNSLNHDRLYDADDMSSIFNNIITDGVFDNYGGLFATRAGTGMQVIVGTGRAWFDSTWTVSDSEVILDVPASDVSMKRIDTVVLEVNHSLAVRNNSIKILKGAASANPVAPTLSTTGDIRQHALCNINIPAGATAITNSMLDIRVGKSDCPFVTSVLESVSIDGLFAKWENDFSTWFADLKIELSGDVAANLQRQIDEIESKTGENSEKISKIEQALNKKCSILKIVSMYITTVEDRRITVEGNYDGVLCVGYGYSSFSGPWSPVGGYIPNGESGSIGYHISADLRKPSEIIVSCGSDNAPNYTFDVIVLKWQ